MNLMCDSKFPDLTETFSLLKKVAVRQESGVSATLSSQHLAADFLRLRGVRVDFKEIEGAQRRVVITGPQSGSHQGWRR